MTQRNSLHYPTPIPPTSPVAGAAGVKMGPWVTKVGANPGPHLKEGIPWDSRVQTPFFQNVGQETDPPMAGPECRLNEIWSARGRWVDLCQTLLNGDEVFSKSPISEMSLKWKCEFKISKSYRWPFPKPYISALGDRDTDKQNSATPSLLVFVWVLAI